LTFSLGRESVDLSISDDYIAWSFYPNKNHGINLVHQKTLHRIAFLDTESMEIKEVIVSGYLEQLNEMAIICTDWNSKKLEMVDPKNRWVVNAGDGLVKGYYNFDVNFGNKLLVTTCYEGDSVKRMRIWKMGNPPVLLQDRTLMLPGMKVVKVDERFIVRFEGDSYYRKKTLCFISTETLEEFGTWGVRKYCDWHYDRGLLFQSPYHRKDNLIRILDVTSGFFNDVRLPVRKEKWRSVNFTPRRAGSNSRFIVIGWYYSSRVREPTNFSFYDLEAAKKPSSDCRCYPLYTLQFQSSVWSFVMDESLIAFNGRDENDERNVTVLNFADFVDRKTSGLEEKQETDGEMKIKITFDSFVDSSQLDNC
jgi:hypothetical protein